MIDLPLGSSTFTMIRLFRVFVPTSTLILLLTEIGLVFASYFVALYILLPFEPEIFLLLRRWLSEVVARRAGCHPVALFSGFLHKRRRTVQDPARRKDDSDDCHRFLHPGFHGLRGSDAADAAMDHPWRFCDPAVRLTGLALCFNTVFSRALSPQRILFLGTNTVVQEIAQRLSDQPELGMCGLGYLDDAYEIGHTVAAGLPVFGGYSDLRPIVEAQKPDRIVVGLSERRQSLPMYELFDLRFRGLYIEEAARTYEAASDA